MEVKISGLDQTVAKLKASPRLIVYKAFAMALDRAGGVIQAEMENRAPEYEEGILKENGTTVVKLDNQGRGGVAQVGYTSRQSDRTGKPADAIAEWVEFGHLMLSHTRKPTQLSHVPAHPFMRPAAEAAADKAIEVFGNVLAEQIESAGDL